jgi:hypothetical protein
LDPVEVDRRTHFWLAAADVREQLGFDLRLAQRLGLLPPEPGAHGPAEVVADSGWRHAARGGDLPMRAAQLEVEPENFSNLAHG